MHPGLAAVCILRKCRLCVSFALQVYVRSGRGGNYAWLASVGGLRVRRAATLKKAAIRPAATNRHCEKMIEVRCECLGMCNVASYSMTRLSIFFSQEVRPYAEQMQTALERKRPF